MADEITPPLQFFYADGTMTLVPGSDIVEGQFTGWATAVLPFDLIVPGSGTIGMTVVAEVIDDTHIRIPAPWSGAARTAIPYFIMRWIRHTDPRIYGIRVSEYLTRLRTIPEDVEAFLAGLDMKVAAMQTIADEVEADRANAESNRQLAENAQVNTAEIRDATEAIRVQTAQLKADTNTTKGQAQAYADAAAGSAAAAQAYAVQVGTGAGFRPTVIKTAAYGVQPTDREVTLIGNSATDITFTLPTLASSSNDGSYYFRNINNGELTIALNGSDPWEAGSHSSVILSRGDYAVITDTGASWRPTIIRANGYLETGTSLAAAATTDLGTSNTDRVSITGAGDITSFGDRDAQWRLCLSLGTPRIVPGANLIVPGGQPIQCEVGDYFEVVSNRVSGAPVTWRITNYERASGVPLVEPNYTEVGFTKKRPITQVLSDYSHSIENFPNIFWNGVDPDTPGIQAACDSGRRALFVPPGKNVNATTPVTLQAGQRLFGSGYTSNRWQRKGVWAGHTVTMSGDGEIEGFLFEQLHPGFVPGTSQTMTDRLISDQAHILYQNGTKGKIKNVWTHMGVYGIKLLNTTQAKISEWISQGSWDELNGNVCETKAHLHVASDAANGQPYNTEFHLEDYYIGGGNTAPLRTLTVGNVQFDTHLGAGCRDAIWIQGSEGGHVGKGYLCANRHGININPLHLVQAINIDEVFIDAPSQHGVYIGGVGAFGVATLVNINKCKFNGQIEIGQRAIWIDNVNGIPNLAGGIISDNFMMAHLRCPVVFFGAKAVHFHHNIVSGYQAKGGGLGDPAVGGGLLVSGVSELVESDSNTYGGAPNTWDPTAAGGNNAQYAETWGSAANGRTRGISARLGIGGGWVCNGVTPLY